jgi:N-acetyl-anhydromuramyl-L-alanine amidase AmpD
MKRGVSTLLREVMYVVLAIIAIVILYMFISKLFGFFSITEADQANGMLANIRNTLSSIKPGETDEVFIYSPPGLYFMTFNITSGPEDALFPEECYMHACICICDETCKDTSYCLTIDKPMMIGNKSIKVQIPIDLMVANNAGMYSAISMQEEGKGKTETLSSKTQIAIPGVKVISSYNLISKERSDSSKVSYIVLHHTGGSTFLDAYNTLNQRGLSVHYIIDREGTIYYLVDEKRLAYHALGFNDVSIGIEIVDTGYKSDSFTAAQYNSIKKLIDSIISRWPNIKYDDTHIIGHYQTPLGVGRKWDPSPDFQWASINLPNHVPVDMASYPSDAKEYGYA